MASVPGEVDAQEYFTEEEWSGVVAIEKIRLTNVLRNYRCMQAQGIGVKPPDFVARYEERKKQEEQLLTSQLRESEASIVQSPQGNSDWDTTQGQTSCDTIQDGDSDIVSPNSSEILQGNSYWQDTFTNFCQFCYIFKLLEGEEPEIKLPSFGECSVSGQSEAVPFKPSNSQSFSSLSSQSFSSPSCSNQPCRCQPSAKTKIPSPIDDSKSTTHEINCQECGQKFAQKKYLKNHMKRFSLTDENRPFKCLFCNHSFVHDKNRKFHERIHNRKLITCCHCSLTFTDLAGARTHMDEEHQNRVHVCHECGYNFSNSSHLMRHKREVRQAYPHQCHVCGHRYLTAVALNRHETYHLRLKTFKCRVCLKDFSSKARLQKHLQAQRTEKKYECPCCKVKFLAHKSFKKHEKIFNGDRPFKCKICGHGYNSKPRLTFHMKVHFKEQPYGCEN